MIRTNKGHIGDIETTNLIEFIWNDLKKTVEAIELRLSPKTRIRSFGNIVFQEIPTFERIGLLPIFGHDGRSVNCRNESPTGILEILTVIEIQLCFTASLARIVCSVAAVCAIIADGTTTKPNAILKIFRFIIL